MADITYERFDLGLDVRKGKSTSDANRMRVLRNANPTPGRQIRKRPCLRKIATLEAGTTGLKGALGKLNTFYESGTITHADTLFVARKVAHPTTTQAVSRVHYCDAFSGFLYASVEYADASVWHHYLDGGSPTHVADANCPHSKSVVKAADKIFGPKNDVVRYSATSDPRDWTTTSDAGFLAVGNQQSGTTTPECIGEYKKQLAVFFLDGTQIWNVDPDPTKMSLANKIEGVGTRYAKAVKLVGGDLFFLSDFGFRSVTVTQFSDNLQDVDIGSPIDDVIRPLLGITDDPIAAWFQANGQYIAIFPTRAWCFTFSRAGKLAAWSEWSFPFTIHDATEVNARVYLRSNDDVFELDPDVYIDDTEIPVVTIEMPFVDMKYPGRDKMFIGVDFVGKGTVRFKAKLNPNDETDVTETITLTGDTRGGPMAPFVCQATEIAPIIEHAGNEAFELHQLKFYFEPL